MGFFLSIFYYRGQVIRQPKFDIIFQSSNQLIWRAERENHFWAARPRQEFAANRTNSYINSCQVLVRSHRQLGPKVSFTAARPRRGFTGNRDKKYQLLLPGPEKTSPPIGPKVTSTVTRSGYKQSPPVRAKSFIYCFQVPRRIPRQLGPKNQFTIAMSRQGFTASRD